MTRKRLISLGFGLLVSAIFVVAAGVFFQPKLAEASNRMTIGRIKYCYHECGNDQACLDRCLAKDQ
ncbi:MAG: hypothetical protein WC734_02680 [Patescibacteria group bacterium]